MASPLFHGRGLEAITMRERCSRGSLSVSASAGASPAVAVSAMFLLRTGYSVRSTQPRRLS